MIVTELILIYDVSNFIMVAAWVHLSLHSEQDTINQINTLYLNTHTNPHKALSAPSPAPGHTQGKAVDYSQGGHGSAMLNNDMLPDQGHSCHTNTHRQQHSIHKGSRRAGKSTAHNDLHHTYLDMQVRINTPRKSQAGELALKRCCSHTEDIYAAFMRTTVPEVSMGHRLVLSVWIYLYIYVCILLSLPELTLYPAN